MHDNLYWNAELYNDYTGKKSWENAPKTLEKPMFSIRKNLEFPFWGAFS
jgi:hypothetical protein